MRSFIVQNLTEKSECEHGWTHAPPRLDVLTSNMGPIATHIELLEPKNTGVKRWNHTVKPWTRCYGCDEWPLQERRSNRQHEAWGNGIDAQSA